MKSQVAIKAYGGLALSNKQMTAAVMVELHALKRLSSFKHIIHIYGVLLDEAELKVVLEWCQGTIDQV